MVKEANDDVAAVGISIRDLAGGLFRLAIAGVSFLAAYAWTQITSDLKDLSLSIEGIQRSIAAQNTKIAVIESTTARTEKLVEKDEERIRAAAERLSRVESACCK